MHGHWLLLRIALEPALCHRPGSEACAVTLDPGSEVACLLMRCCCRRLEQFSIILQVGAQIFILHGALRTRTHRRVLITAMTRGRPTFSFPGSPFHRGGKRIAFIRCHTHGNLITKPGAGGRVSFWRCGYGGRGTDKEQASK